MLYFSFSLFKFTFPPIFPQNQFLSISLHVGRWPGEHFFLQTITKTLSAWTSVTNINTDSAVNSPFSGFLGYVILNLRIGLISDTCPELPVPVVSFFGKNYDAEKHFLTRLDIRGKESNRGVVSKRWRHFCLIRDE